MTGRIFVSTLLLLGIASSALAGRGVLDGHRFVEIRESALQPRVHRISAADSFGWANQSGEVAVVSFDALAARRMICTHVGGFRIEGERLESAPIETEPFVSRCHLAPGTYAYRVELRADEGQRHLEGTLIIE